MAITLPVEGFPEEDSYEHALKPTLTIERKTQIGGAIVPYTVEYPEEPIDEVPVLITAGFYGIEPGYREIRNSFAEQGKIAITYRRGIRQGTDFFNPKHFLKPYRLTQQSPYAVMKDLHTLGDFEQFDVVGHSMGGTTAADIARHHPEYFRSIILLGSAGLNGHGISNLAKRSPLFIAKEVIPAIPQLATKFDKEDFMHAVEYVSSNPIRVISEALHVAKHDIREDFTALKEANINSAIIAFTQDEFFPIEEVRLHSADLPDSYQEHPGKHTAPQVEPKNVATTILNMLSIINS
ncbi:alpha/beta hydrolase [Candidatus Saccharibacteria bacterium]|nr:alpha/beta hydrolase [Candidatus Saccharibacteria bacterium]